ncbi:coatomer subunit beta' [Cherax quadricarinatus]
MPLRLDVKRKLTARSDRVKSVDLHPTEPWMLASLYNGNVHVWNIESQQLVKSFEVCDLPVRASRFVARKNWVVTGSDDMQVRIFNYNTLERVHQFEAHSDYVRCIAVHPTQPFILTCSDDMTIKLWNWDKKWSLQQMFEGHSHYVMQIVINPKDNNTFASASLDRTVKFAVSFHPELPIILTGSEDCTVRVWHANTYRLENTLNYGLDRVWCICALKGSNNVCFGYDEGSVMVKLGREEPAMSMDVSGKIVWARHSEIQQANLKAMGDAEAQDGERLPLAVKDLGACDIYPQTIAHNPNGRFVVVCGDGEYIIYTAMALRNKAFGPALEFVWALDSSEYAIRESNFSVKLFKNFKEKKSFKPDFGCEGIYGGYLLGCRSSSTGLAFYDWETQELVRRIEIQPRQVFWSENGDYVCIATDENYFILKYSPEAVANARENKEGLTEDGIEDAFDLVGEVQEIVKTGKWVGDCFIYTNSVNRLNYYVGGEIVTIAHLDRTLYLIGYIPKDNRLYLGDKELNVVSYELLVSVLEYQTAVMRRDFDTADRVLPTIPPAHRTRVAHFLEKQGFKKQALAVSTDPEHRNHFVVSITIVVSLWVSNDLAPYSSVKLSTPTDELCSWLILWCLFFFIKGNAKLIREVGNEAENQGRNNVAFLSYFLTGNLKDCLELLIKTNRVPEAAFFARTYLPNEMSRVVGLWKEAAGEKIGQSLADPAQYDNLFPGLKDAVKTQHFLEKQSHPIPAAAAASVPGNHDRNPMEEMHAAEAAGTFLYATQEEDSEFVDAPQQPPPLINEEILRSIGQEAHGEDKVLKMEEKVDKLAELENLLGDYIPPVLNVEEDEETVLKLEKGKTDHTAHSFDIFMAKDSDNLLLDDDTDTALSVKKTIPLVDSEKLLTAPEEEQEFGGAAASAPSSVVHTRNILGWDEDEAEDWGLEQERDMLVQQDAFESHFEEVTLKHQVENGSPESHWESPPITDFSLKDVQALTSPGLVLGVVESSADSMEKKGQDLPSWQQLEFNSSVDFTKTNIVMHGASARVTIDQAQLERELELDLEKVRIEDNVDPNDLNLDEEELLAD